MGTLVLVRHGQATPFEDDTDRLSELGRRQAEALARHWLAHGVVFDAIYRGSLVRHRDTEAIVAEGLRSAGRAWPEVQVDPRLNEYDGDGVIHILGEALARRDPEFAALRSKAAETRQGPDRNRHFQHMFERLAEAWRAAEVADPRVETWAAFHARVRAGLKSIMSNHPGGQRVAVFTSGGPIGVSVQSALDAPEATAMRVNWRVRNASLTTYAFGGGRVSLDGFNDIGHLPAELLSWR